MPWKGSVMSQRSPFVTQASQSDISAIAGDIDTRLAGEPAKQIPCAKCDARRDRATNQRLGMICPTWRAPAPPFRRLFQSPESDNPPAEPRLSAPSTASRARHIR